MSVNSVFYAESYHPIQAGSIDGTDIAPHDNGVYRALLCSSAGLYDPFGDPKVIGDPYRTVFIGRLSHLTTEDTLRKAMSRYGRVTNLRLVRHIVTGASRGYAFVEYETDREMRRAYEEAHHSIIDDSEILVDYNRQQLMPGWIPRRLGGGLGGKKESGQLRFGGRERPFRAPLRPIPYDSLKSLGIPSPPEGRYMSRFQVPSPPRREKSHVDKEESSHKRSSIDSKEQTHRSSSMEKDRRSHKRSSTEREDYHRRKSSVERGDHAHKRSVDKADDYHHYRTSFADREELSRKRSSRERERSGKHDSRRSHEHERSTSQDHSSQY